MADIDVPLKQWALTKFLVVSDGKLPSINEKTFTVHGEATGSVSTVQQLARGNVEAETVGEEHNEILWSYHSHTVVMHDKICWVDELIYSNCYITKKLIMLWPIYWWRQCHDNNWWAWLWQGLCSFGATNAVRHTQEDKESNKHWSFAIYNNGS